MEPGLYTHCQIHGDSTKDRRDRWRSLVSD